MKSCISYVLEKQSQIISLQNDIVDCLAIAALQHGMIEEEELAMIKEAADLQKGLEE